MISTAQETIENLNETGSNCYTCPCSLATSAEVITKHSTVTSQKDYNFSCGRSFSSFTLTSDFSKINGINVSSEIQKVLTEKNIPSAKILELLGGVSNILSPRISRYVLNISRRGDGRILIKINLPSAKIGEKIQLLEDCNSLIYNIANQFENKSDKINFQSSFFVEIAETKNGFTI